MASRYPMDARYTKVAIALHWTIAALILFNLATGFFTGIFPRGIIAIHISSGITVLLLTVVRIVWRLTHRPPPFDPTMKPWERTLAHVVHFGLYAAMLLVPLSGWAMISANPPPGSPGAAAAAAMRAEPAPPKAAPGDRKQADPSPPRRRGSPQFWGLFTLPLITPLQEIGRLPEGVPAQHEKHEQIEKLHLLGGYLTVAMLLLHILGAWKHQLLDGQPELQRMGVGPRRRV